MSNWIQKKIKITKLSDDHFEGNHPNGIYKGYEKIGYMHEPPTIGDRFHVFEDKLWSNFSTSLVIEALNDDNVFKTTYSTYKIEYL